MPRRTVLVVANELPAYDATHGDHRTLWFARALSRRARVVLMPLSGMTGRRRYAARLRAAGIELVFPRGRSLSGLIRSVIDRRAVTAVLFDGYRSAFPLICAVPPDVRTYIDAKDINTIRIARAARVSRNRALGDYSRMAARYEMATYGLADTVIAINDHERRIIARAARPRRTVTIPVMLDERPPVPRGRAGRAGIVFFGGFLNDAARDAARYLVRGIMPLVWRRLPDVRLTIAGHGSERLAGLSADPRVTCAGPVARLLPFLGGYLACACPLRFGAGSKKKIVDALASGLPVVTTPVGAEGMGLRPGTDVLVVRSAPAFAAAVVRLCTDPAAWDRMSRQGYARVRARFDPRVVERQVTDLILRSRRH